MAAIAATSRKGRLTKTASQKTTSRPHEGNPAALIAEVSHALNDKQRVCRVRFAARATLALAARRSFKQVRPSSSDRRPRPLPKIDRAPWPLLWGKVMDRLDEIHNKCKRNLDEIYARYEAKQKRHWRNYWTANCLVVVFALISVVASCATLYYLNKVKNATPVERRL